jgi:hypothetical protein
MNSWAPASRAADSICSGVASGAPYAMLSRIDAAKSRLSWSTTLICPRSDSSVYSRISRPSMRTTPPVGSYRRMTRFDSVVLPPPEGPTSATCWPGSIVSWTFLKRRAPRLVFERHVIECDFAAEAGGGDGAGQIAHIGLALQDVQHALGRRGRLGQSSGVLSEIAHGAERGLEISQEDDQVAGREPARDDQRRAAPQD